MSINTDSVMMIYIVHVYQCRCPYLSSVFVCLVCYGVGCVRSLYAVKSKERCVYYKLSLSTIETSHTGLRQIDKTLLVSLFYTQIKHTVPDENV